MSLITTGSISRLFGEPALATYMASRAAVVYLTCSLAIDCARLGIRISCARRRKVVTGFNDPQFLGDDFSDADINELNDRTISRGRQCLPEKLASAGIPRLAGRVVHHWTDVGRRWGTALLRLKVWRQQSQR